MPHMKNTSNNPTTQTLCSTVMHHFHRQNSSVYETLIYVSLMTKLPGKFFKKFNLKGLFISKKYVQSRNEWLFHDVYVLLNAPLEKQTQFAKQNKKFPHAYFREIYLYEVQLRSMGQIEMS